MSKMRKKDPSREEPGRKYSDAKRRRLLSGSYSIAVTAIALAVIAVVNLIVLAIPDAFTSFDVTDQKLYSIGEISKGVLDSLKEPVTLYLVTEAGQEDEAVGKLAESYAAYSDKVRLETVDAVANPTFTTLYTEEAVPLNSVIAVCGENAQVASYYTFYGYDSYYSAASSWDAEGQITSAIASAAGSRQVKAYYTTGHDELDISSEMTDSMTKANIGMSPVNLLSEEIPADCDVLMICAPAEDIEETELKKVLSYLENGGRLLLLTMSGAVTGKDTPVLDRILLTYGITRRGGLVMEGNAGSYVQAPYLLLPETGNTEVTKGLENLNIVCALPEAIEVGDTDEAVYTVNTLLASSGDAYVKAEIGDSVEKESGDESGQFVLGVAIEETPSMDSMGEPDVNVDLYADSTDLSTDLSTDVDTNADGDTYKEAGTASNKDSDGDAELHTDKDGDSDTDTDVSEYADNSTEKNTKATRILYYSTPCLFSSAALSTLIQQQTALPEGNTALFSRSMAYLAGQEAAIAVEAKSLAVPQSVIDTRTQLLLGNVVMLALPALVLAAGFVVMRRRRKR